MTGKIHSLESFGTVDGPGIRFVVFMQGCPLRCLYCHNPDTWDTRTTPPYEMTPEELLGEVLKYKNFIANGGITVTGGEPLLQAGFLYEFFRLCRERQIHTALDTSGIVLTEKIKSLLEFTDLVLLDIKALSPDLHEKITGSRSDTPLRFLDYLKENSIPTWIRHVVTPGLTDTPEQLEELAAYLTRYPNIHKVELLPYHTMGTIKYEKSGREYPLKDVPPLDQNGLTRAQEIFKKHHLPL